MPVLSHKAPGMEQVHLDKVVEGVAVGDASVGMRDESVILIFLPAGPPLWFQPSLKGDAWSSSDLEPDGSLALDGTLHGAGRSSSACGFIWQEVRIKALHQIVLTQSLALVALFVCLYHKTFLIYFVWFVVGTGWFVCLIAKTHIFSLGSHCVLFLRKSHSNE